MELLVTLLILYATQCIARLPDGAALFVRLGQRVFLFEGPGWRLRHPRPSGCSWVTGRFPLVEEGPSLRSGSAATLASDLAASAFRIEPQRIERVEMRGTQVRVNGTGFARTPSKHAAQALCNLLEELAGQEPEQARRRVASAIEASLQDALGDAA